MSQYGSDPFGRNTSVQPSFSSALSKFGKRQMEVNGLTCTVHLPEAAKSRGDGLGGEEDQALPPGAPRSVFSVDQFNDTCPKDWLPSDRERSLVSYFFASKLGHGMWLDFNGNQRSHTHDVAVVISVQRLNALTRMPVESPITLEKYRDGDPCPNPEHHGERLHDDLMCDRCGYKWPKQNYLATTGTPWGYFWLDGFRADDGVIRQFVFTPPGEGRGIAQQVLGDERSHSIGIAFFLSRQPKPPPALVHRGGHSQLLGGPHLESLSMSRGGLESYGPKMEVAAGARVRQNVYPDPKDLSYWETTPAGLLVLNYCFEDEALQIITSSSGSRQSDGALSGLRVGN